LAPRFKTAFPVSLAVLQWQMASKLANYSCGGSRGITAFPFRRPV
jgi:hypothetical protein